MIDRRAVVAARVGWRAWEDGRAPGKGGPMEAALEAALPYLPVPQPPAISSTDGGMREALSEARKALRPFEWASQYVDHRLVGEPMAKQFIDALGKLTVGNWNDLARACTKIDAALARDGGKEASKPSHGLNSNYGDCG